MYLLQTLGRDSALVLIAVLYLIGIVLLFFVIYYLIRSAVHAGTRELRRQLKLQSLLKIYELRQAGFPEDQLQEAQQKAQKEK